MAGIAESAEDDLEKLVQQEKVLKAFIKKLENQKERLEIEESDLVNKIQKARAASSSLQPSVAISEAPSTAPTTSAAVESGIHFEKDVNRQSINLELDLNPVIKPKRQQEEEEEEEEDDDDN